MSDPITPYLAGRARGLLAVLILAIGGLFGYALHQRNSVNHLSAENSQIVSLLKDTRAQMATLTSKLDAMTAQPAPAQPSPIAILQTATSPKPSSHRNVVSRRHSAGDPRFKRFQTQLDAQGKAIESTRQELASTRSDLQGSIAKTHEDVVALQKKGERNYYEFDLDKSKQFRRAGQVGISLRKASTKDMYADLKLMVDDAQISKKHVNLFEPVFFYLGDEHRPVELVINSIHKNHIHGYISSPRFSASELAASSPAPDNAANANGQPAPDAANKPRRKLEVPR